MNYQQERMLQTMQSMADTISARAELASLDDRAQYSSRRTGATEGLRLTVQRAAQVIKIVNAQVKTLIGTDNGALLAQWEAATHVGRKPGVAAGSTEAGFSDTAGRYLPASPGIIRNFRNLASCITDTSS